MTDNIFHPASLLEQIAQPEEPLKYLGHEEAQKDGTSIGYAAIGERRDTLLVPPLANITVSVIELTCDVINRFVISTDFCFTALFTNILCDKVRVPLGTYQVLTIIYRLQVRFVANKYTGDVVVHCHLLPDADQGMMMMTQVVEKGGCGPG